MFYHESKDRKHYKDYAVDGVLLYSSYLKDSFNVTAIAISGESEREKKISSFIWLKGNYTYKNIQDKILLSPDEVSNILIEQARPITENDLVQKAIEYNKFLNTYSIPEVERCTLISSILISLQDEAFLTSYKVFETNKALIDNLLSACQRVLEKNGLDNYRIGIIIDEFSKFKNNNSFNGSTFYNKKSRSEEINTILKDFIMSINDEILPYIKNSQFDVLGKFYTQFIRYAGGDKKTGLVLTPNHITDFFCEVATLNVNDIVFDECCGTAGFLVSAMNYMLKKAGNDENKRKHIRAHQLLGIENRSDMFSHACSNMMMRGDGKSHIEYGSCFDEKKKEIIKEKKPTAAFLNPPYQDRNTDEQLEFIENALDCIVQGGICIAICQIATTVSDLKNVEVVKERLMSKHTLEAVFSMPEELFNPAGAVTSILIFKAHNQHPVGKKTFLGYFRYDGFEKTKNHGRVDKNNEWTGIKDKWLNAFLNKEAIPGLSLMQEVKFNDEWCAECYMIASYSNVDIDLFKKSAQRYLAYRLLNNLLDFKIDKVKFEKRSAGLVPLFTLFDVYNGLASSEVEVKELPESESDIRYIRPSQSYEGSIAGYVNSIDIESKFIFPNNTLYVSTDGQGSHSYSYLSSFDFVPNSNVSVLIPKVNMSLQEKLYYAICITANRFKFSYGRKPKGDRLKNILIPDTPPDFIYDEVFEQIFDGWKQLIN